MNPLFHAVLINDCDGIKRNHHRMAEKITLSRTVLHVAAERGCNPGTVRTLLQHGADPCVANANGDSALATCARWDRDELLGVLVKHLQGQRGDEAATRALCQSSHVSSEMKSAIKEATGTIVTRMSPLTIACASGAARAATFLCSLEGVWHAEKGNHEWLLVLACQNGCSAVVKLLLSKGLRPDSFCTQIGLSPLQAASNGIRKTG